MLRDKIAASLYRHAAESVPSGIPWLSWENAFPEVRKVWLAMADDVLRDLGLRQEWCVRHESGGGRIVHSRDEARRQLDAFVERPPGVEDPGSGKLTGIEVRYVTEWEPDE